MTMGPFNWSQVLRHEFTHTVTLSATDNRIAHWMTEGLAVLEEKSPLQWHWVPMLNDAVKKNKLFTIENLTWAFVRPRKPTDRQLAYAESYWICTYVDTKYGRDKILAMLDQFRAGRSPEETFQKVLNKTTQEFETEFFAWAGDQVKGWGYDEETSEKVEELSKKGEALIQAGDWDAALPMWQEINKLRPMDQTPHRRLASIYLKLKKTDEAVKHLEALDAVELKDNSFAKGIARIYRDRGENAKAVKYAKQAVYIDPYDEAGHELLAQLYEKTNDQPGLSREKRVLNVLTEWRALQRQQEEKSEEAPTTQP
jgi:tetratricopeptide (TPR) repeat protein